MGYNEKRLTVPLVSGYALILRGMDPKHPHQAPSSELGTNGASPHISTARPGKHNLDSSEPGRDCWSIPRLASSYHGFSPTLALG